LHTLNSTGFLNIGFQATAGQVMILLSVGAGCRIITLLTAKINSTLGTTGINTLSLLQDPIQRIEAIKEGTNSYRVKLYLSETAAVDINFLMPDIKNTYLVNASS